MWDYQFKQQQTNVVRKKSVTPPASQLILNSYETKPVKVIYLYSYKLKTSKYS